MGVQFYKPYCHCEHVRTPIAVYVLWCRWIRIVSRDAIEFQTKSLKIYRILLIRFLRIRLACRFLRVSSRTRFVIVSQFVINSERARVRPMKT